MIIYFFIALAFSVLFTYLARLLSVKLAFVDLPDGVRKRHTRPVALLGGAAIFLAFWLPVLFIALVHPTFGIEKITNKLLVAFIVSCVLVAVGIGDDVKKLSPQVRLLVVGLAMLIAVAGGIGIAKVTNPVGGSFELGLLMGDSIAFMWLMGMIFTVKILDGLDGLATGVALIGALVIYFLTQTTQFFQPNVGVVSLIFAGVLAGFLFFNFHPASIYLGESGGLVVGFILGVLAIISGSKIATALLVMAVPIVDIARVMYVRRSRHQPIFQGDREHFHYQLLEYGMSEWQVVLLFYSIALITGLAALFLQSIGKIIVLLLLLAAITFLMYSLKRAHEQLVK